VRYRSLASAAVYRTINQVADEAFFSLLEIAKVAINRLADDAPLWSAANSAESRQRTLHLRRDADAELRVILHSLADARAGRRSTDRSSSR
jgi:hypothetical protein